MYMLNYRSLLSIRYAGTDYDFSFYLLKHFVYFLLLCQTIRKYEEAIEGFNQLLLQHSNCLPGLKGVAEAHIRLALNLTSDHRYGRAKYHLQMAMNRLQE